MRITDTHIYFWGSIFSNFYEAETTVSIPNIVCLMGGEPIILPNAFVDITFRTSEHAFMAYKAVAFDDAYAYMDILGADHPATAKGIGRTIKGYDDKIWSRIRYDRMEKAVLAKFSQNSKLKQKLIDTGNKVIVEASPVDKVWGVGLAEDNNLILDEKNWKGENLLGKVLMDVREKLKNTI